MSEGRFLIASLMTWRRSRAGGSGRRRAAWRGPTPSASTDTPTRCRRTGDSGSRLVERRDRILVGLGEIVEECVELPIDVLAYALAPAAEVQHRRGRVVIFAVTLVWSFTKRRTGDRSVQLAGHLHAARLGLDAGELDALRGVVAFGAAELLKEVEMPPGAAAARVALAKNRASSIVACEEVPATVLWAMSCLASGWVVFGEEPLSGRRSRGQYLNGTPATDPARARQSGQGQCSRPRQGRRSSCLLHRFSFGKRPLPPSIRSVLPPASCGWRKSALLPPAWRH